MKVFIVICTLLVAVYGVEQEVCTKGIRTACSGSNDGYSCNAILPSFLHVEKNLQAYAFDQLKRSYDYLLLATNFGTYVKNRPGFEKMFKSLSDKAFDDAIDLITHMTTRGGKMDFQDHPNINLPAGTLPIPSPNKFEVNEIQSLAIALDTQKELALKAQHIHLHISHANRVGEYDPEIAHYIEEEFLEDQAKTIRKISGYTNDLEKLLSNSLDNTLSLYLFDEYLQKQ